MNKIRNLRLCAGLLLVAIGIFFALTNGQKERTESQQEEGVTD